MKDIWIEPPVCGAAVKINVFKELLVLPEKAGIKYIPEKAEEWN